MERVVYACDIGSIRAGTFAWARSTGACPPGVSTNIDLLVERLSDDAAAGLSIALGFESPLYMPVPELSSDLNRGRSGEGSRSMFAPAGASVTTLGIHEAAWVLRALHDAASGLLTYTLDWRGWPAQDQSQKLLLWEAFVSGPAHSDTHERDAATAAMTFIENEANLDAVNAVSTDHAFNLVHAAALWSGWAKDIERLKSSCLVIKPQTAYKGAMGTIC